MFIEITKINSHGEVGKALIRVEDIVGIREKHVDSVKLFNAQGDLISETPATTKDFQILVNSPSGASEKFHVDQNEYERLVSILVK